MRTTLDLNEGLLKKAMRLGRSKTKTELIHASLEAFIQRKRIEGLMERGGHTPLALSPRDLRRLRANE